MDRAVHASATDVASDAVHAPGTTSTNSESPQQCPPPNVPHTVLISSCRSPQQQPHDGASETTRSDSSLSLSSDSIEAASALQLRRSSSLNNAVFLTGAGGLGSSCRSRRRQSGDEDDDKTEKYNDGTSTELVLQLQRLCRRQRQRAEERAFVRDVERVLALLRAPVRTSLDAQLTSATFPGPGMSLDMLSSVQESKADAAVPIGYRQCSVTSDDSMYRSGSTRGFNERRPASRVTLTLSEIYALLDCIADLFEHRNPDVRALAFEVVQLCVLRFGERLTPALRRKIYLRLESHPPRDFLLRQKVLRTLTQDGRHVEPFHVELGWFLLRLLEQSDAQRDLLGLIQIILRRSPQALDRDKVIAIVSVIGGRCDIAWSRSDLDACHKFSTFFHVLATHDLAYAASAPACLRSLCCLVNADGHGTWSVMKLLLTGGSGFVVLRGLVQMLEHPMGVNSPWVLRGAVFFVGMSCWGSQRLAKFDDTAWGPILLALERALQCCRRVVVFEIILSIQRLIKKFGAAHLPAGSSGQSAAVAMNLSTEVSLHSGESREEESKVSSGFGTLSSGANRGKRCLIVEWDIILRMLHTLRPWASMTDDSETAGIPEKTSQPNNRRTGGGANHPAAIYLANDLSDQPHPQLLVSIQQARVPRELLDTLQAVEDLVERRRFAGDVNEFLNILEQYCHVFLRTQCCFYCGNVLTQLIQDTT
uniref:Tuberin N-terminal domain-containing protein n=1 Tax=Hyaloperonospora arabidopsidis (strain Emoy2) TaxID=559515 RepID=M4C275_HYAAE